MRTRAASKRRRLSIGKRERRALKRRRRCKEAAISRRLHYCLNTVVETQRIYVGGNPYRKVYNKIQQDSFTKDNDNTIGKSEIQNYIRGRAQLVSRETKSMPLSHGGSIIIGRTVFLVH